MKFATHFFSLLFFIHFCVSAQQRTLDSLFGVGAFSSVVEHVSSLESPTQKEAFLWASALQNLGQDQEALTVYATYLEEPFNPKYIYPYAKLLTSYAQPKKADDLFSALIEADSTNGEYYYQRAKLRKGSMPDAFFEDLEKGFAQQPNHLKLANFYVRELIAQKRYVDATRTANQVFYNFPNNPGMHASMGQLCFTQKDYRKSIFHFEHLIDLPDTPLFVLKKLGDAYTNSKDYDKALTTYERLLQKNEEDHYLMVQMAELYALNGNTNRALELNNLAYAMKDVSREKQLYTFGFIFQQKKDYAKAIEFYKDCLAENPVNEKALFARATCADQLDLPKKDTIKYYEAYAKVYPKKGMYSTTVSMRLKQLKREAFLED